jgi:integrase
MGSIFHKTFTREVPASAKLVEKDGKTVAQWRGKGGRKLSSEVVTLNDGRKVVRVESDTYFAKYRNADHEVVTISTGCRDKSLAEQFLSQLERDSERVKSRVADRSELQVAKRADEPIGEHVKRFVATFRGSGGHRKATERNLCALIGWCNWKTLSDLTRESLEKWLVDEEAAGRSARSRNAYHVSIVTFCNWCVDNKRLTANPFAKIEKANEQADKRRPRRALTQDEFQRFLVATRSARKRPALKNGGKSNRPAERLSGQDRADVYLVLVGTGLRVGELAQLRVGDLHLDARTPGFDVRAEVDKAGREHYLPLHADLVTLLRRVTHGKKSADLVFNIPSGLIQRFDADLKRAGIPKIDDRGLTADIHSLRKTFGTWLAMSGVFPQVTQKLMRHADVNITMRLYTDLGLLDFAGAVNSVPMLHQIMHQTSVFPCPSSPLVSSSDSEAIAS